MIEDLFKNNKLEFVNIVTKSNENNVKHMELSSNIYYLKYFYVDSNYKRVDITLDISIEHPKNLQVY